MSVAIIDGNGNTDQVSIDAVAKAMRVTLYDVNGTTYSKKDTYRASNTTTTAVVAGTAPFFVFYGSDTKIIRIRKIFYTGTVGVAAVNVPVVLAKYSTQPTGGTPAALTKVPLDSNSPISTANLCQLYTAAPTAGSLVGAIEVRRGLHNITGAVATVDFSFDYSEAGALDGKEPIILRSSLEGVALFYAVTPGNATAVNLWVEWTEE